MSAAAASTAGRVLLQNVTSAAEGVYKCEVSTEAPNFDTDYKESNLSIIGELFLFCAAVAIASLFRKRGWGREEKHANKVFRLYLFEKEEEHHQSW